MFNYRAADKTQSPVDSANPNPNEGLLIETSDFSGSLGGNLKSLKTLTGNKYMRTKQININKSTFLTLALSVAMPTWAVDSQPEQVKASANSFITRIAGGVAAAQGLADFHIQVMPKLAHGAIYEQSLQKYLGQVAGLYTLDATLQTYFAAQIEPLSQELADSVDKGRLSGQAVTQIQGILQEIMASPMTSQGLRDAIDQALIWIPADAAAYNHGTGRSLETTMTTLLVKLKAGADKRRMESLLNRSAAKVHRFWEQIGWYALRVPAGQSAQLRSLLESQQELVEKVEQPGPLHTQEISATVVPNDPKLSELWGMKKIQASKAWDKRTSAWNVVVAVTDTGKNMGHEDLTRNKWINIKEIPNNNVDEDHNGYVDDVLGWDFVSNDNDPEDDNDHGSHVSGTLGALGNNGKGVVGVAWRVRSMPLKFLDSCGSGSYEDAIDAIFYAANNGAHIISASWAGGDFSQALFDSIQYFGTKGGLFVAAAANDGKDNDKTPVYPASFPLPNILVVAATDANDMLADFSNYGMKSVDVAAPGVDILSTVTSGYVTMSGTSMATPHVSGLAALLKAQHPTWRHARLKSAIIGTVDKLPGLNGKIVSGGRINAAKALALQ